MKIFEAHNTNTGEIGLFNTKEEAIVAGFVDIKIEISFEADDIKRMIIANKIMKAALQSISDGEDDIVGNEVWCSCYKEAQDALDLCEHIEKGE